MKPFVTLIFVIIAFFAGVWFSGSKKAKHYYVKSSDTVVVEKVDSIFKTAYVPTYKRVERVITDTVTLTDTVFIVRDWNELRVYVDTLRDSLFTIFLTDTVTQNQIIARSWNGQI